MTTHVTLHRRVLVLEGVGHAFEQLPIAVFHRHDHRRRALLPTTRTFNRAERLRVVIGVPQAPHLAAAFPDMSFLLHLMRIAGSLRVRRRSHLIALLQLRHLVLHLSRADVRVVVLRDDRNQSRLALHLRMNVMIELGGLV